MPKITSTVILQATTVEIEISQKDYDSIQAANYDVVERIKNEIKDIADTQIGDSYTSYIISSSLDDLIE